MRPYVLSPAEWNRLKHHRQQQHRRRRALWLAVHDIDIGPRPIRSSKIKDVQINGVRAAA
ncbi:hypothetical protein [Streptomyces alanosinicus]|uniref:hypothetical protein n=1 Tax=Streptomyces alanosinicus TaxID=68171 RepID=UPI001E637D99|nr:hypothetical protein [Streptomyces alanosinicus]